MGTRGACDRSAGPWRIAVKRDAIADTAMIMLTGMTSERERAWSDLHATLPSGWYVGTPSYRVERREWALYAFDTREKAHIGKRSREWTALAPTEDGVVREMARCLREIAAGPLPK